MKINRSTVVPAFAGTLIIAFLLLTTVSVARPGDHDSSATCGTALSFRMEKPRHQYGEEHYFEQTYMSCTSARVTRVAQAVGVLTLTLLATALLATFGRDD